MAVNVTVSAPRRLRLIAAWYGLGCLVLLAVAVVSLTPVPVTGVNDKLSHFVTYYLLAGWFGLLVSSRTRLIWTAAGLIVYGILIELLQGLTTYRFEEWGDAIANAGGVICGTLLYFTPLRRGLQLVDERLARAFMR